MTSIESFRSLALSIKGASEAPHFERTSFRIAGKIFATLDMVNMIACFKLTPAQQQQYSLSNAAIVPVPNKWGQRGWTNADLKRSDEPLVAELLQTASANLVNKR